MNFEDFAIVVVNSDGDDIGEYIQLTESMKQNPTELLNAIENRINETVEEGE